MAPNQNYTHTHTLSSVIIKQTRKKKKIVNSKRQSQPKSKQKSNSLS